jgi:hypothetical protein
MEMRLTEHEKALQQNYGFLYVVYVLVLGDACAHPVEGNMKKINMAIYYQL